MNKSFVIFKLTFPLRVTGMIILGIFFFGLFLGPFSFSPVANAHFVEPEKEDMCPICGMSISDHPKWVAVIMFSDGKHVKLHGPKSMFTYYLNLDTYNKKYKIQNISTMHVTDYSTLEHVKAQEAYYVIQSDIQGPMGDDLLPFKDKKSAEAFTQKHGGNIIFFKDITPNVINSLKNIISDKPSINQE